MTHGIRLGVTGFVCEQCKVCDSNNKQVEGIRVSERALLGISVLFRCGLVKGNIDMHGQRMRRGKGRRPPTILLLGSIGCRGNPALVLGAAEMF